MTLQSAVESKNLAKVKEFLAAGADVNAKNVCFFFHFKFFFLKIDPQYLFQVSKINHNGWYWEFNNFYLGRSRIFMTFNL